MSEQAMHLIAQISDLHVVAGGALLSGRFDTAARLDATVAHLNALDPKPELVIATGDLVENATAEEYSCLRACLAPLEAPLVLMPGNHDIPAQLAEAFPDHPYLAGNAAGVCFVAAEGPPRILALDTVVPGRHGGFVGAERLDWLDRELAATPETPTIIAMHHPPFSTGLAKMDAMGCGNADALAAVLARHPQVERILCGHLHRRIEHLWNGILTTTAPATSFQITLDLRPGAALSVADAPPAFQLHLWRDGHGLVSHTCYTDGVDGRGGAD